MKIKIRKKIDELFALPPKPGKKVKKEEKLPKKVHAKANKWAKEKGMSRKQAYGKAIGMHKSGDLEESFPHGGMPYGGSRKQDAEAEHAGHVERSKHQGLKNVIEQMIDEELGYVLDEIELEEGGRCKGPTKKASSDRKGKKWQQCVKQPDGSYKRVHWGQKGVKVTGKSGNTKRKKSFRARHKCHKAKKGSAQAQACKDW